MCGLTFSGIVRFGVIEAIVVLTPVISLCFLTTR